MISRTQSSALFKSSMSLDVPYHLTTLLCSSSSGTARIRNQRYCPSARRRRASFAKGFPPAKAARHSSIKRSSGWNAFIQPQPRPCSRERPVYSRKVWLRKSAEPSGNLLQTIVGIVSIMSRRRSSITLDASTASLPRLLVPVWLMLASTRSDLAVVRAFASLSGRDSCIAIDRTSVDPLRLGEGVLYREPALVTAYECPPLTQLARAHMHSDE